MEDSVPVAKLSMESGRSGGITNIRNSRRVLATFSPQTFLRNSILHIHSRKRCTMGSTAVRVVFFLLEVAALELARRISSAKCPFAWRGFQALQLICYPPFKWMERWAPFKGLVRGMQMLSRPLLVLSVATAFSDLSESVRGTSDSDSDVSDSHAHSEPCRDLPPENSSLGTRRCIEGAPHRLASESWMVNLYRELENQGISLPERLNEDELHRFYMAANEDFSSFLSSIKKTIRWRETYSIMSGSELEMWTTMVFWHGFDVKHRPCLIVRLGLACSSLPSHDRPRFAQAVVSHIEHGVVHLLDANNPQITVLVDCEGLSPLKIPMQMMRSCSALLHDHFPNRLGCLFVIRLPPVLRVISQTFIQVLKPVTRKKLRIVGEMYQRVLPEYLLMLPSYLGGKCDCTSCLKISACKRQQSHMLDENTDGPMADATDDEDLLERYPSPTNRDCNQILRSAVIGLLIVCVFVAIIAGMYDAENEQFLAP